MCRVSSFPSREILPAVDAHCVLVPAGRACSPILPRTAVVVSVPFRLASPPGKSRDEAGFQDFRQPSAPPLYMLGRHRFGPAMKVSPVWNTEGWHDHCSKEKKAFILSRYVHA